MTHAEKEARNQKIVELRKQGYSMNQLSEMFHLTNISNICKRYGVDGVMSDRKADYENINYRNQWTKERQEEYARNVIDKNLFGFTYVGNYTGSGGTADIKCGVCGGVFVQPFISIRQGNNVVCPYCKQVDIEERERARKHRAEIRQAERKRESERRKEQSRQEKQKQLEERKHPCPVCGKITSRQKYCSYECGNKASNKGHDLRRRRKIQSAIIDHDITVIGLYKRDNGVCYLCGGLCNKDDYTLKDNVFIAGEMYPTIDHVIPLARGGSHSWSNVKLAHKCCNTKKSDKIYFPMVSGE